MKTRLPPIALCALSVAALALAGCGDSGSDGEKLPRDLSQSLMTEVEQIEARVDANVSGACDDIFDGVAGGNFDETARLIESIPENVDPGIRSALSDSVDHLQQLASSECDEIQAREPDDTTVPDETVTEEETTPTETETTPTETETTPTETETTPTTPTQPDTGDGNGNGNGPDGNGPPGQDDGGGVVAPDEQ